KHDQGASAANRAPAARRQSGPQRAGHRRDQLSLPARLHRFERLRRLDRLRVQAEGEHDRWPAVARGARCLINQKQVPRLRLGISCELVEGSDMANVGFIGLGIMGSPMAAHLIKGGHRVFLYSLPGIPPALVEAGGKACANSKEVAQEADIIITMVPDTPHVEAALFGNDGVAQGLSNGKIVVDMSSISPLATKEFAEKINALGCDYLDAPVSGGEVGAKAASLTIMVGGSEPA